MGRFPTIPAIVGVILGGMVAGCGGGPGGADGFLHVGNGDEPGALDPHLVTGVPGHRVCGTLFEGLVNLDPATLEPRPGVAESWDVSGDGLVYTFLLREDARWSNGDPVTAEDFAWSWQRILSPGLAAEYAYMLFCIEGAEAFSKGETGDFGGVGVRVVDPRTLEVRLAHPTPYFLTMQVHGSWLPVHRGTIEAHGAMDERGTKWTRPENFVGNGAFTLAAWRPNEEIRVAKNPEYWAAADVRLPGVVFHPIRDLLTEERNFRVGELHMTENVPVSKIDVYREKNPELLHIDPYLGVYYYRLNVTRPPLDDIRVRRALAMAVDRETLVERVVKGGREPAFHYVPPDTAGYTSRARVPYDVARARDLLAEAGYPDGEGLPPVQLLYNTSENHKIVAAAIQQMWRDNLNVTVELVNQDWKVYLSSMNNLDYGIARSGWIGDVVDPVNFLECYMSGNGNNRTGYASAEYDALLRAAEREADPARRFELFQQAEERLLRDAPIIPLYFYTRVYLMWPSVRNWRSNVLGYISFKDLYLAEPQGGGAK